MEMVKGVAAGLEAGFPTTALNRINFGNYTPKGRRGAKKLMYVEIE